jgi:large conductance mechanosensitive channel
MKKKAVTPQQSAAINTAVKKEVAATQLSIKDVHRAPRKVMADFLTFVREQGVIALSIAVVLGGAVTRLVQALVADLINPVIGVMVGAAGDLASMKFKVGPVEFLWGHFAATLIDFVIVASVIYLLVRMLGLDKIDKKKA